MESMPDIDVHEASKRASQGVLLIDVREPAEHALGMPLGAVPVPLAVLLAQPSQHIPQLTTPVLLLCASGNRSKRAQNELTARGYTQLVNVSGGFSAWRSRGLPESESSIDALFAERFDRHLRLAGVGLEGQKKLAQANVLVLGAGGLGSPAAFYLAAAGVGHLRIVDDDVVERSNLQRQILHTDAAVGTLKVDSARERLLALNPTLTVEALRERCSSKNIERLMQGIDVVLDGTDNFATRYLVNAACVQNKVPLVYGAVERFNGQLSVFDAGRHRGLSPCYRCLFPEPPGPDAAPNCAEAGVLGVLPGLVGVLQATEALKLILGIGQPMRGRLLLLDALTMQFRELSVAADPACPDCSSNAVFAGYTDLEQWCASA